MTTPNDLREAYTGQRRGPQAGFASCLSNSAAKFLAAGGDGLGRPEPNPDRAVVGEALEGLPGSKSVARVAEAARNQGDPAGSRRTNYEGQAGRGVQRPEERPEARPGVGFVHSSLRQDASLEAGEGANRLTKQAPATSPIFRDRVISSGVRPFMISGATYFCSRADRLSSKTFSPILRKPFPVSTFIEAMIIFS